MYYFYDYKMKGLKAYTQAKDHALAILEKQKESYRLLVPLVSEDSDLTPIKRSITQCRHFIKFMNSIEEDKPFSKPCVDLWREEMKAEPIFLGFLSHFKLKPLQKESKNTRVNLHRAALLNNYKLTLQQAQSTVNNSLNQTIETIAVEMEKVQSKLQRLKLN